MIKVFITRKLPDIAENLLKQHFKVECNFKNERYPQEKLQELVKEYDAILSTPTERFTQEVLKEALVTNEHQHLKVLSNYGVGLDNIDVEYAKANGISVYNTPDVVTNSTADLAFALLLSLIRKIQPSFEYIKQNNWKAWDPFIFNGEELNDKIFGIIGFGRIGQAVAKRAIGFGLKVIYYDTENNPIIPFLQNQVLKVDFDYLLSNSDYITLHVPLTVQTKNLINKDVFMKMSKAPVLINTSRGAVVNTDDLAEALKQKYIRGAALDVTNPEPITAEHPLLKLENCLITPHIGTATVDARYNMAKLAAENIINHFTHDRPGNN